MNMAAFAQRERSQASGDAHRPLAGRTGVFSMRIMFATCHKSLPEIHGGMERNTKDLALKLTARGHEVLSVSGLAGVGWLGLRAKIQLKILRRAWARDKVLGYTSLRSYAPLEGFDRIIDQFAPDAVVIQGGHLHSNLMDVAARAGKPAIMYYHSAHIDALSEEQMRHGRIRFVANSRFTASLCSDRNPIVIRPIVCPEEYYVQNSTREFITFVNPSPHKGLAVVTAMARRRSGLAFLFARTRRDRNSLPPPTRLPGNVTVAGPVGDMRRIYGRTRLVLAPSQCDEAWCRVATEAQLSGIPVLASDRGGLPEAVGAGGLCLPAAAKPDRWLEALDMITGNEERYRRFAEKAFEHSKRKEMDPGLIVEQFERVLAAALRAAAARPSLR